MRVRSARTLSEIVPRISSVFASSEAMDFKLKAGAELRWWTSDCLNAALHSPTVTLRTAKWVAVPRLRALTKLVIRSRE